MWWYPPPNGPAVLVTNYNVQWLRDVAADDAWVYFEWEGLTTGHIVRTTKEANGVTEVLADQQPCTAPGGGNSNSWGCRIAVDDDAVYWTTYAGQQLMKRFKD